MNALFVANFASNTGYAWDTIETVFAGTARQLSARGYHVAVAYASLEGGLPVRMAGLPVEVVEIDYPATARSPISLLHFLRTLRRSRIHLLYLTDQPAWSLRYGLYRVAGVRRIVVHDRTSGSRVPSTALLPLKRVLNRSSLAADSVVAVSEFVAARLRDVSGTDAARTIRIYNGIDLSRFHALDPTHLRRTTGIPDGMPIVFYAGRANRYKGVDVLIRAMALLQREGRAVGLVICGDGPDLPAFRQEAAQLELGGTFFLGKRDDVASLLAGATVCVVPSVWEEAFGLTVVEGMAAGKAVVAARTGGIPELIEHGVTGLLVAAGDAAALADAIRRLLDDDALRHRIGDAAREHAAASFSAERTINELVKVLSV